MQREKVKAIVDWLLEWRCPRGLHMTFIVEPAAGRVWVTMSQGGGCVSQCEVAVPTTTREGLFRCLAEETLRIGVDSARTEAGELPAHYDLQTIVGYRDPSVPRRRD